jgi:hypothetical protein
VTQILRRKRHRPFTPTSRDDRLCQDGYCMRLFSTEQIAERFCEETESVYFPAIDPAAADPLKRGGKRPILRMVPSRKAANERLKILRTNGLFVSREHRKPGGSKTNVWMLSKSEFRAQAEYRGVDPEERYPGWPRGRVQHLLDTNDLYVKIAGDLDATLGPNHGRDPGWEWLDERRAHDRYAVSWDPRPRYHQPDAEVLFCGCTFVVERQSGRAKETEGAIRQKVLRHKERAAYLLLAERSELSVVFACDQERDARYAREAAQEAGLALFAGTLEGAADHLIDAAMRLSP